MDMSTMTTTSGSTAMVMDMVFFNAKDTPLYSNAWTPTTNTAYAFTCIFCVIFSIILRCLIAAKSMWEVRCKRAEAQRPFVVTAQTYRDEESKLGATETVNSSASSAVGSTGWNRPWRLSVDLPRALFTTVIVGVGYLLMLAVMSMNIGYFLSVLAGVFVGELFVGRFAHATDPRKAL